MFGCMERWYKWLLHVNTSFSEQMSTQCQFSFSSDYVSQCLLVFTPSLSFHFGVRTFVHKVTSGHFWASCNIGNKLWAW